MSIPVRLLPALAALLAAAACTPFVAPVAVSPAPIETSVAASVDLNAQARNFVETLSTLGPVAVSECEARSRRGANCDFRIVVDDRPGMPANAFQTRDEAGRPVIGITLALIADVGNADELAFIISHEVAHHILGHLDRQSRNATIGAAALGQLAHVLGATDPARVRQLQELGAEVGARTYSQEFELEADRLGTIIAWRAGFDPLRGAAFFDRIPDPGNRFLGTHPPNRARVAVVRQTMAELAGGR